MNKYGFSWKRLAGITSLKNKVSRTTGIPLTKSGRERKIGKIVTGGGCLLQIGFASLVFMFLLSISAFSQSKAEVVAFDSQLLGTPTRSGTTVQTIPRGTIVQILLSKGNWCLVQTTDFVGWVLNEELKSIDVGSAKSQISPAATTSETDSQVPVIVVVNPEAKPKTKQRLIIGDQAVSSPSPNINSTSESQSNAQTSGTTAQPVQVPTGHCKDGTQTFAVDREKACIENGGIESWAADKKQEPTYTPPTNTGGSVQVKGYYRKDGTYVRPHTRRRP